MGLPLLKTFCNMHAEMSIPVNLTYRARPVAPPLSVMKKEHTDNCILCRLQVGTEFSTGIPFLAEGKISVEVTGSYSHTWGTTESETKTWSVHDTCTAGPGTSATCEFFVNKVCSFML